MKIVKSLKVSGLLMNGFNETNKYQAKEQKRGFHGMLLGSLSTQLLGNFLAHKLKIHGEGVIRTGEGIFGANQHLQCHLIF